MDIKLFFNWSQEDEGAEIIHFPDILISQELEGGSRKYWTEAAFFIQSLDTTAWAYKVLNTINFYMTDNFITRLDIKLWNDVKATVEDDFIMFKRNEKHSYEDKFEINLLLKILPKWIDYLKTADKQPLIFSID